MQNRISKRAISAILLFCMIASIYGTIFYVSEYKVHHCSESDCKVCFMVKDGNAYLDHFSSSNIEPFFNESWLLLGTANEQITYLNPVFNQKTLVLLGIRMNC